MFSLATSYTNECLGEGAACENVASDLDYGMAESPVCCSAFDKLLPKYCGMEASQLIIMMHQVLMCMAV
jgi:hypothetical protein